MCSQLFDHTSVNQFLETFINKKYGRQLKLENISQWRRTISGDLTAAFSPFNGEQLEKLPFLDRDKFVGDIYSAQFKKIPTGFKQFSEGAVLMEQEKGVRPSCALPYELYADAVIRKGELVVKMRSGNDVFGKEAIGAPFLVYAPGAFKDDAGTEVMRSWNFAVKAGDTVEYRWPLDGFEHGRYHLRLYGPNGFYRELTGAAGDPEVLCEYERDAKGRTTGNVVVKADGQDITVTDNAYKQAVLKGRGSVVVRLGESKGWYDFTVTLPGSGGFERRYAGRVETGKEGISDPFMGRVV